MLLLHPFVFVFTVFSLVLPSAAKTGGGGGVTPDEVSPSQSPSPAPSAFLEQPSSSPVAPPSDEAAKCVSTDGEYGDDSDDILIVNWKYAVSLSEGVSESDFTSSLLPQLEITMNNALLPFLFDCSRRSRLLRETRLLAGSVIGVSVKPSDTIESDVPCSGSNCHGLLGMLTLFLDGSTVRNLQETSSHIVTVRNAMKANMDSGKFNSDSGPILTVTWVGDGDESGLENPGTTAPSAAPPSSDKDHLVAWVAGSTGLAVLIAAAALYAKRRRDLQEHAEFDALDGSVTLGSS